MFGMKSEKSQRQHAVGFTAPHTLAENEYALITLACEAAEAVAEELFQAIREIVLREELLGINLGIE